MKRVKFTETRTVTRRVTKSVPEGFHAELVRARMAIGNSPAAMARAMGIGAGYYYALESGRVEIGPRTIKKLNAALNKFGYAVTREIKLTKGAK